jgi:O-Antigen ligase
MASTPDIARSDAGKDLSKKNGHRAVFVLFAALTLFCVIGGGSAFPNIGAVIGIRIAALALIAAILLMAETPELRRLSDVSRFSIMAIGLVAVQLVPLPPGIWAALPGHSSYAEMATVAVGPVWRPVSMTPDLTLNTLLALLVPISAGLAAAYLGSAVREKAAFAMVAIGGVSAMIGLLQLAPGGGGLRWYAISNDDSAIGLFTNRNHHGVFLAALIPVIAAAVRGHLARSRRSDLETSWLIGTIAVALGFAGVAVATGSRFGTFAALIGLAGGVAVWRSNAAAKPGTKATPRMRLLAAAVIAGTVAVVVLLVFLPGSGLRRLFADGVTDDLRMAWLTPMLKMAAAFQPFGTGFGSFDSIYRGFEPFELLQSTYLNAAHNDLLQIAIEGGVGALALFAIFFWWWIRTAIALWSTRSSHPSAVFGRAATISTGLLLTASLFDYPLRTPLLGCLIAVLLVWMHQARSQVVPLPTKAGSLGPSTGGSDRQKRQAEQYL